MFGLGCFAMGVVTGLILFLPGYLYGSSAVRRLFRQRDVVPLTQEQLLHKAGLSFLARSALCNVVLEAALFLKDGAGGFFPVATMIAAISAPTLILLTLFGYSMGRRIMADQFSKLEKPDPKLVKFANTLFY